MLKASDLRLCLSHDTGRRLKESSFLLVILDFITTRLTTLEARLRESRRESSELDATGSNLASSFQPVFTGSNRFLTKLFSGKTSLINSLAYMIKKKDGETAWRAAASYDLGKKYKFKVNYYQIFTIL